MKTAHLCSLLVFVGIAISGLWPSAEAQAASASKTCTSAKQCKGPLPMICMVCSDGASRCAHWVCAQSACVVETCPPKQ